MYIFWGRVEAETKAKQGPTPKLYITILLTRDILLWGEPDTTNAGN
jgi:hypothetical protein